MSPSCTALTPTGALGHGTAAGVAAFVPVLADHAHRTERAVPCNG